MDQPLKKITLKCTVTGKEVTYTSAEYIAKRIAKAGSLEHLIKTFVCKEAKSAGKAPKLGRTWGGKEIISSAKPAVEEPDNSVKPEMTHYTWTDKDGCIGHVWAPKHKR